MTKERMERIKRAGEYQRMAILELFPEETRGHLQVIGKELKQMAEESVAGLLKECCVFAASMGQTEKDKEETAEGEGGRVKKVTIL